MIEQSGYVSLRSSRERQRAEELVLLLQSMGLAARARFSYDDDLGAQVWSVEVPEIQSAAAEKLLAEEEAGQIPSRTAAASEAIEPQLGARSGYYWVLGLILINALIWWAMEQRGGSESHPTLLRFGAITSSHLMAGDWWRSVTAVFLHIGARHLLGNMLLLLVLGLITLHRWGPGRLLLVYVASGVLGNWAAFLFGSAVALKAGASGAILGLLGALAGERLRQLRSADQPRFRSWHVLAMLVAFYGMVVGIRPQSDHVAHVGGLIGGALVALLLPRPGSSSAARERTLQLVAGGGATLLCLIAGLFAARSAGLF